MAISLYTYGANSAAHVLTQSKRATSYLFGGAAAPEQQIGLAVLAGGISLDEAVDKMTDLVERSIRDEGKAAVAGLHTAFVASGDWDRVRMTAELRDLHPLAWERFDELTSSLRLSLEAEGLVDHVAIIDNLLDNAGYIADREAITDEAWQWLKDEMDTLRATSPVRLHASQEMRGLLHLDNGFVDPEAVRWLLANRTADNQPVAGKHYKPFNEVSKRTTFHEICFSPPKSVSVAWAFAGPEERVAIRAAQEAAVDKAMEVVAEHLAVVRRGKGGVKGMEAGEIAWIAFGGNHAYSRKSDPQLHTHVAILNLVRSLESGRIGSLPLFELHGRYRDQTFEIPYQRELARGLAALGFDVEIVKGLLHPEARIVGIPEPIIEAFSRRAAEAKEKATDLLLEQDISIDSLTPDDRGRLLADTSAISRRAKEPKPPEYDKWVEIAIAAVGTEEWNRMAAARGWVHQRRSAETERIKEAKERWAAGLAAEYHRGGSREMEWGLSR